MTRPPLISIVVCTFNRAAMLQDALRSLLTLETAGRFQYEIVVIDNASTDATANVVASLRGGSPVTVRYAFEAKKGIASARNRGVREATGEWIAFFDDDQLADRRWLLELFAYAQENSLRGVGGAVYLRLPHDCTRALDPYVCMLLGESRWSDEPFPYSPKISPGTGNLMLHRTVFEQIGLFNERFATRAEDTDLFCRMHAAGIETWYVPSAIVHHVTPPERLTANYLQRLARGMGEGIAERECDARWLPAFAVRYVAKVLMQPTWSACRLAIARAKRDGERSLALECRLVQDLAFCGTGWRRLFGSFLPAPRPAAWSAAKSATSA
jgi:glycosyltransferase involved in cell wall biosynthesis